MQRLIYTIAEYVILAYSRFGLPQMRGKFVLGIASDLMLLILNPMEIYLYCSFIQGLVNGILSEVVYPSC